MTLQTRYYSYVIITQTFNKDFLSQYNMIPMIQNFIYATKHNNEQFFSIIIQTIAHETSICCIYILNFFVYLLGQLPFQTLDKTVLW